MRHLANIFWLGTKELRSLGHDPVLIGLIVWAFGFAIYSMAQGQSEELHNAAVAIVDEDQSALSRQIAQALLPPYFKPPQAIAAAEIDRAMDVGRYTFVIDVPPNFQRDAEAGRRPALQV